MRLRSLKSPVHFEITKGWSCDAEENDYRAIIFTLRIVNYQVEIWLSKKGR